MVRVLGFLSPDVAAKRCSSRPADSSSVKQNPVCCIFGANGNTPKFRCQLQSRRNARGSLRATAITGMFKNLATLPLPAVPGGSGRCAGFCPFAFGSFFTRYSRMCRTAISVLPFSTAICAFCQISVCPIILLDSCASCYHAGRIEVRPYDRKYHTLRSDGQGGSRHSRCARISTRGTTRRYD